MKQRTRIAPISAKRLAAHPELKIRNSTVLPTNPTAKRLISDKPRATDLALARGGVSAKDGVIPPRQPARSPLQQTPRTRKPRSKKETERVYGSPQFRAWLYDQPCAVCGWKPDGWEYTEACHAKTGGMARKSDAELLFPGCPPRVDYRASTAAEMSIEGCHREMHRIGVKSFEKKHGVKLLDLAAKTWAAWLAVSERANWAQPGKRT